MSKNKKSIKSSFVKMWSRQSKEQKKTIISLIIFILVMIGWASYQPIRKLESKFKSESSGQNIDTMKYVNDCRHRTRVEFEPHNIDFSTLLTEIKYINNQIVAFLGSTDIENMYGVEKTYNIICRYKSDGAFIDFSYEAN